MMEKQRIDGKPTIYEIAEASKAGALNGRWGAREYEIITFRGVEILVKRKILETAIEVTHEWTHDLDVEKLSREMGITLRRFR